MTEEKSIVMSFGFFHHIMPWYLLSVLQYLLRLSRLPLALILLFQYPCRRMATHLMFYYLFLQWYHPLIFQIYLIGWVVRRGKMKKPQGSDEMFNNYSQHTYLCIYYLCSATRHSLDQNLRGRGYDRGFSVQETYDGGFIVVGLMRNITSGQINGAGQYAVF